jgi:predicted nucleic acid-binding protein
MIVLDTDHLSELQRDNSKAGSRLLGRLEKVPDEEIVTTIVSTEEQMRGRLEAVRGRGDGRSISGCDLSWE